MMQKKRQGYHYVCRWYRNDFFGSQPFFGGLWSASSEIRASTLCPGSYPTVVLGLVGPWPVPFSLRNDAISGPKSLQFTEISWCSSLAAKFSWPSPTDSNHLWNLALIWCSTVDLVDDKIQQLILVHERSGWILKVVTSESLQKLQFGRNPPKWRWLFNDFEVGELWSISVR